MAKARPHHKKIIHHHNENAIAFSLIFFGSVEKVLGIESALLPNREWGQKQKHKKLFRCKQSAHWKHAKGMSLRYDAALAYCG